MIKSLQGIRVIAMFSIFLLHCNLLSNGTWAVMLFFILSGFVTYLSMHKKADSILIKDSVKFSINKMKEMYPLHLITLIISIPMRINFIMLNPIMGIIAIFSHILLIQSIIPVNNIYFNFNEPSWYISAMIYIYLFTNIFVKFVRSVSNKKINPAHCIIYIYIVQLIIALLVKGNRFEQWILYINPLFRSFDYLIGMFLGQLHLINKEKSISRKYSSIMEIGTIAIFLIALYNLKFVPRYLEYGLYFTPFITILIYIISLEEGIISNWLGNKILLNLSKISFEFFMIHMPVIILVGKIFEIIAWPKMLGYLVAFFITLILSKLYNTYFDRKSLGYFKNKLLHNRIEDTKIKSDKHIT